MTQQRLRHAPNVTRALAFKRAACLLLLFGAIAGGPALAQDDALGRLFFTPERRAELDRQRTLRLPEAPPKPVEGATLTVNGVVSRSGGKSTVWVNGVPHDDNRGASDLRAYVDPRKPDRATLNTDSEPTATLRVGETIDRSTRARGDGLQGGSVIVRRGATQVPSHRD